MRSERAQQPARCAAAPGNRPTPLSTLSALFLARRLLWSPTEFDELFQTVNAVRDTVEQMDDAQFGAVKPWFAPLMRHVSKLARSAVHMLSLFEEQQDKWYFRPAALAREAGRLDNLLQDAMGVIASATQGVPPSPQSALQTPEARTFWLSRVDPEGACFELDIKRFQAAVVEELDPDGGWTSEQKVQYLEVMAGELDKHNLGLVSVYDFSEFTAEKGLRVSCMQLFLRLILTFGSRKMEAVRKQQKMRDQAAELRAGHGDNDRVIEWMEGEGFAAETAGILLKNELELGDLWRLRDSEFKAMGIHSMGCRRKLLAAARRLRSLYLKPAPGGFAEWMESQGLEDYIEVFSQHRIDFDVINEVTHETLQEMGIHFGDRVRVLRAVESLKAAPSHEQETNYPLAGLASLFGKMEGQYKQADLGAAAAAKLARQSIAEFVTGEFAVAGVDRDLTLAERKLLVARDALGFVASVVDGQSRKKLEAALATIARDYEKFQEDLVLDMSTVLDAMRSESTRANRQLMGEACYMLRGMMTGVLLGPDHALNSLTTAERRKVVATHDGLDAVMQCILDATGDADDSFLLQAFECLCELGGAEACRAQMAEEGTASLVLSLMAGHLANPRVCELGCHLSMQLMHSRPEVQETVANLPYDGGLAVVLTAMRAFPADGGVQCCGVGALSSAAENASNSTLLVAQGGARTHPPTSFLLSALKWWSNRAGLVVFRPAAGVLGDALLPLPRRRAAPMARMRAALPRRQRLARRLHAAGGEGGRAGAGDGGDARVPCAPAAAGGGLLVPRHMRGAAAAA